MSMSTFPLEVFVFCVSFSGIMGIGEWVKNFRKNLTFFMRGPKAEKYSYREITVMMLKRYNKHMMLPILLY